MYEELTKDTNDLRFNFGQMIADTHMFMQAMSMDDYDNSRVEWRDKCDEECLFFLRRNIGMVALPRSV